MLSQLRDIHEPALPSAWPWAPGWWLLLLAALAGAAWLAWRWWQRHRKVAAYQRLLTSIEALGNGDSFLAEFNMLLKEAACHYDGKAQVAALSGADWTRYLASATAVTPPARDALEMLEAGPYAPSYPIRFEYFRDLKAYAVAWIKAKEGLDA
ncbi:DUF4381 domain-containing protein [Gallaecimonas sp. GXIMD4217]|uniref:DUF4381 domain-containing protein n=1 Tax=Gallaecimonas sp. GXIMD4217 TaxID=3131927 RepID=UPI00311AC492